MGKLEDCYLAVIILRIQQPQKIIDSIGRQKGTISTNSKVSDFLAFMLNLLRNLLSLRVPDVNFVLARGVEGGRVVEYSPSCIQCLKLNRGL